MMHANGESFGVRRFLKYVLWSAAIAWFVSTSAAASGAWLAHLDTHQGNATATLGRLMLTFMWLPALLSDRLFGYASSPFHTADDAVANMVAYVQETFLTVFVLSLIGFSLHPAAKTVFGAVRQQFWYRKMTR